MFLIGEAVCYDALSFLHKTETNSDFYEGIESLWRALRGTGVAPEQGPLGH